jgi:hypothetical protein
MKCRAPLLTLIVLFGIFLLAGCAQVTRQPVQDASSRPSQAPSVELTPTDIRADTSTQEVTPALEATPTPEPSPTLADLPTVDPSATSASIPPIPINLAGGDGLNHELVFAIRNEGRYSGEGGLPAWLGWGADNLAVAPDGSFWIADTPADPDRLLHYNHQGELLQVIPMRFGERQYWARDVAAGPSGIWVLDIVSQPGLVLHFSLDGILLENYEIPEKFSTYVQEGNVIPGLWHIPFGESGSVLLDGPIGIVELTVTDGNAEFKQVKGYPLGGRVYSDVENGLMIDNLRVGMKFLQPDHFLNNAWLLGVVPDGSFYVREDEANNDQGKSEPPDRFVRRYSASGDLLGIALLPLPELDQAYDVTIGSDGNAYAMYSRADHSVEILRLCFVPGVAPLLSPIIAFPQLSFTPLLPSGLPPATDLDAAREAMLSFFSALNEWRYDDAAALFGGSYDIYKTQDEAISADQPGMAWQIICTSEFCLPVSDILESRQSASDTYEFLVGFASDNGFRFDYSICCGNFDPTPSTTWFVYSVKVEKVDGQWKVMGGPIPLP